MLHVFNTIFVFESLNSIFVVCNVQITDCKKSCGVEQQTSSL